MDPQILLGLQNSLRDIHSVKANSIFIRVVLKTLDAKLAAAADDPDDAQDQIIFAESDSSFFQWARWVASILIRSLEWLLKINPSVGTIRLIRQENLMSKTN